MASAVSSHPAEPTITSRCGRSCVCDHRCERLDERREALARLERAHPEDVRDVADAEDGARRRDRVVGHHLLLDAVRHDPDPIGRYGRVRGDLVGRGLGQRDDDVGALGGRGEAVPVEPPTAWWIRLGKEDGRGVVDGHDERDVARGRHRERRGMHEVEVAQARGGACPAVGSRRRSTSRTAPAGAGTAAPDRARPGRRARTARAPARPSRGCGAP